MTQSQFSKNRLVLQNVQRYSLIFHWAKLTRINLSVQICALYIKVFFCFFLRIWKLLSINAFKYAICKHYINWYAMKFNGMFKIKLKRKVKLTHFLVTFLIQIFAEIKFISRLFVGEGVCNIFFYPCAEERYLLIFSWSFVYFVYNA